MVSGNDMYSIPPGKVGIGTTSPEQKLTVGSSPDMFNYLRSGYFIKIYVAMIAVWKHRDSARIADEVMCQGSQ
jgi:hypothetical protein